MAMEEESNQSVHVLMVAFTAQGHINPLLRFGKRLQSKGLRVTLATTEVTRQRLLKLSSSSTQATTDSLSGINLLYFSDGVSLDYDRASNLDTYIDTLSKFGPINLSNLIKELYRQKEFPRFGCVIVNPFVPWAAAVAEELGVPCAMLWIQPCALFSIYYHSVKKLTDFPRSEKEEQSQVRVKLPGLPVLEYADLPTFILPSDAGGSLARGLVELIENIEKFKWILANSCYELEKDACDGISELVVVKPVGPLVPPILLGEDEIKDSGIYLWKPEDRCIEWLDKKPKSSVVYVSFGSYLALPRAQMENVAKGLKNSGTSFLWVVKPPEKPAHEGDGLVPEWFLEETKEQGIVVGWCEQTLVLSHPSIACFVSHCGWNSTLEAICAGVPVIGFPHWTDQPTNAKLVVEVFGVGVRLRPGEYGVVSSEELEKCIGEVISGGRAAEYREKAADWKRVVRSTVADGGSSDRNIQLFVDELTKGAS